MMTGTRCEFRNCKNSTRLNRSKIFHRFPTSQIMRSLWLKSCEKQHLQKKLDFENGRLAKSRRVCSDHFSSEDYGANKKLFPCAIPKIHSKMKPKLVREYRRYTIIGAYEEWPKTKRPKIVDIEVDTKNVDDYEDDDIVFVLSDDHTYAKSPLNEPKMPVISKCYTLADDTVKNLKNPSRETERLRTLLNNSRRAQNFYRRKSDMLVEKLVKTEQEKELSIRKAVEQSFGGNTLLKSFCKNMNIPPHERHYSEEETTFCLNLFQSSPAAYQVVSKKLPIPSLSLISKWINNNVKLSNIKEEIKDEFEGS